MIFEVCYMSYDWNISRNNCRRQITKLLNNEYSKTRTISNILQHRVVKYKIDDSLDFGEGLSNSYNGIVRSVVIGTKGLFDSDIVRDEDFAETIWTVFHEGQHVKQSNEIFRNHDGDEYTIQQALEDMAMTDNELCYMNFHNYERNSNEIQAEMIGFMNTADYLRMLGYSDESVNNVMLNVVNKKCQRKSYFLQGHHYNDVNDVINDFQELYINSFDDMIEYPMPYSDNFKYHFGDVRSKDCPNKDCFAICAGQDVQLRTVFPMAQNKLEQLKIMSAVACRVHYGLEFCYPVIGDMDLSYETIIEQKYEAYMRKQRTNELNDKFDFELSNNKGEQYE